VNETVRYIPVLCSKIQRLFEWRAESPNYKLSKLQELMLWFWSKSSACVLFWSELL